jgi:ribonuclease P protein component
MAFGRGWRPLPAGGYWRRGVPRAASAFPPKPTLARAAPRPIPISCQISPPARLERLKVRADFLRVAAARRRAVLPGLILQAAPRPQRSPPEPPLGVGFTASRKIGNAVTRNRAKRRLRAAAAAVLPAAGHAGTDYVLVARSGTAGRPYKALIADLALALRRLERIATPDERRRGTTR